MILKIVSLIFLLIPSMVLSEVGFRDLKIGSNISVIEENCFRNTKFYSCYGIDDLKFNFADQDSNPVEKTYFFKGEHFRDIINGMDIGSILPFCEEVGPRQKSSDDNFYYVNFNCYGNTTLRISVYKGKMVDGIEIISTDYRKIGQISIDLGPLYQTFLDNIVNDPNNPYIKLKKSLESNYQMEWEFTERDQKLFNEGERNSLWTSYNGGQIFSEIVRRDKYSNLSLSVHYHTKVDGKKLSEKRKPQNVNFNDF